jgi:hypothetical protein
LLSYLEKYAQLTDDIELKLDEADKAAALDDTRYTPDETSSKIMDKVNGGKNIKSILINPI